jgi:hypothetical protein
MKQRRTRGGNSSEKNARPVEPDRAIPESGSEVPAYRDSQLAAMCSMLVTWNCFALAELPCPLLVLLEADEVDDELDVCAELELDG